MSLTFHWYKTKHCKFLKMHFFSSLQHKIIINLKDFRWLYLIEYLTGFHIRFENRNEMEVAPQENIGCPTSQMQINIEEKNFALSGIGIFLVARKEGTVSVGNWAHIHKNLSALTSQVHTQNLRSCFNLCFQIEEFVGVVRCKIYILNEESRNSKHNVRIRTLT